LGNGVTELLQVRLVVALPVPQPNSIKALKDESVPDWRQHEATMLPR